LELGAFNQILTDAHELVPRAGESSRQRKRDHAVVVYADADAKPVQLADADGFGVERQRRLVVLHVGRSRGLGSKAGRDGRSADETRNRLKVDCFRDVEQIEEDNLRAADLGHPAIVHDRGAAEAAGCCGAAVSAANYRSSSPSALMPDAGRSQALCTIGGMGEAAPFTERQMISLNSCSGMRSASAKSMRRDASAPHAFLSFFSSSRMRAAT